MRYEARMRMVDKFISQLKSEEYLYKNEETTERLVCLIYNAIYSLSRINSSEWNVFLALFKDAKVHALAGTSVEREKTENYNNAVSSLLATFDKYNQYLKAINGRVAHPMNVAI
jgi:hypothetical protein